MEAIQWVGLYLKSAAKLLPFSGISKFLMFFNFRRPFFAEKFDYIE